LRFRNDSYLVHSVKAHSFIIVAHSTRFSCRGTYRPYETQKFHCFAGSKSAKDIRFSQRIVIKRTTRDYSRQKSVFKENGIQKMDFVLPLLPHWEEHIRDLLDFFRSTIERPGTLTERIVIAGSSGTGKTASAKVVGFSLEKVARRQDLNLVCARVNCSTTSVKFGLMPSIIRQATLPFLSENRPVELLHALWDHLNEHDKFGLAERIYRGSILGRTLLSYWMIRKRRSAATPLNERSFIPASCSVLTMTILPAFFSTVLMSSSI